MSDRAPDRTTATASRDDRLAAVKGLAGGVLILARATDGDARPRRRQAHAVLGIASIAAGVRAWRTRPAPPPGPQIGAGYAVALAFALRSGREERNARRAAAPSTRRRGPSGLLRRPAPPDGRGLPTRSVRLAGTSTALGGLIDLARALERDPDDEQRTWLAFMAASSVVAGVGETLGRTRVQWLGLTSALAALAVDAALLRD